MSISRTKSQNRLLEIDALRGVAIVLMVVYHLVFDLYAFHGIDWLIKNPFFWEVIGRSAAILFFLLFGVSSVYAKQKYKDRFWQFSMRRCVLLLACASGITLVSLIITQMHPIYFGVLHFLGVSALLVPLFIRFLRVNLLLAFFCGVVGFLFLPLENNDFLLMPFVLQTLNVPIADYYPLVPWLGIVLAGIVLGNLAQKSRLFPLVPHPPKAWEIFSWPGRHALIIYMVHQPILTTVLWLLNL